MDTKAGLSKAVGLIQAIVGFTAIVFAFLAFYNVFEIQIMLGVSPEYIELYLWVFVIFGLLSSISGLFLLYTPPGS